MVPVGGKDAGIGIFFQQNGEVGVLAKIFLGDVLVVVHVNEGRGAVDEEDAVEIVGAKQVLDVGDVDATGVAESSQVGESAAESKRFGEVLRFPGCTRCSHRVEKAGFMLRGIAFRALAANL